MNDENATLGDILPTPELDKEPTVAKKAAKKPSAPIALASPVRGKWKVSCSFECHKDRTPPSQLPGTDIVVPIGTPVYAAHSGVITVADNVDNSASGKWVQVTHGKTVTYYLHLSKVNVKKGARVAKGSLIGHSGNTGASTGPHLHFSLKINGKLVDPDKYI